MKKTTLLLLLLSFNFITAQNNLFIESYVIEDDTELPVKEAKVIIEDIDLSTYTDENGFFSLEKELPEGNYIISVLKEGYDPKFFMIKQQKDLKIKLKEVRITVNKKEAKRRKKALKEQQKIAEARLKEIEKERRKKEALLKKQKEKLLRENTVVVEYDSIQNNTTQIPEPDPISETQIKYAEILEVDPLSLTNKELYNFIDEWMGTPYLWGGETKDAIDCSSFSQRLFIKAYDLYLERTAQKQCSSKLTELFTNEEHLTEGDLLFFGEDQLNVVHVGVYLHNNKFVHATSQKVDGEAGVKISDLKHPYWAGKLISAGRRKAN